VYDLRTELNKGSADGYSTMMKGIFDVKHSPTFDNWDESDWLCDNCISDLLSANLHLWLLECQRKSSVFSLQFLRETNAFLPKMASLRVKTVGK
jgi:hypothetical protein